MSSVKPNYQMKAMSLGRMGIALLIVLSTLRSVFGWEVRRSPHAELLYESRDSQIAESFSRIIEDEYGSISGSLGFLGDLKIQVILAPSEEKFQLLTGGRIPDWGGGCALPGRNLIILKHSSVKEVKQFQEVLSHELAHVIFFHATKDVALPRWFEEGIAMWQAAEWDIIRSWQMTRAVISGRIIPLSQIEYVLSFPSQKAQLAYTESLLAIVYLFKVGGPNVLRRIIEELRSNATFDQALLSACGHNEKSFAISWESFVKERYNLLSLVSLLPDLWVILAVLVLIAYVVVRIRMARKRREWESEEKDGDEEIDLS